MNSVELKTAFDEFAEMRKEIKAPLTTQSKERYLEHLKRHYPEEAWIPMLRQSIKLRCRELYPVHSEGR